MSEHGNIAFETVAHGDGDDLTIRGTYNVLCTDNMGRLKWKDDFHNVVPNQGKNAVLDSALAGAAFTAAYFLSLMTAGAAIATSTYAAPTVTEVVNTVLATRVALTWTAAAAGVKASAVASCAIIGAGTITGAMVVSGTNAIGNTVAAGGVLLSAGVFSGGNRIVASGDTLNISYSLGI